MYLILGIGAAGYHTASQLRDAGRQITLVDIKPERIEDLKEMGFEGVIEGDITSPDLLRKINVKHAQGVLILTKDVDLNIKVANTIRELNSEVPIVLRAAKQDAGEDLKELAIDEVIYPAPAVAEKAIRSLEKLELQRKLKRLSTLLAEADKGIAIVTQDNPDPDAIASAVSLKRVIEKMDKAADIIYGGEIGY